MVIFLGADHRGFQLKENIKKWLLTEGYEVQDMGNSVLDPDDDYVDFGEAVARKVSENHGAKGILFCGSGVGMDMTANRFPGVRSAFVFSKPQVELATSHDYINVLAVPADFIEEGELRFIISAWLLAPYSKEERYVRRVEKLEKLKP